MKTIQEYLKIADTEKLIQEYFKQYPIEYEKLNDAGNKTVLELREIGERKLREYIFRLRNLEIKPSDNGEYILFVSKYLSSGFSEEYYGLVNKQELLDDGDAAESYCYTYDEQAEIMGFFVSDAEYTQENIYSLMVSVMYEASFFGYSNEHLQEEIDGLKTAAEEIKAGKCHVLTDEEDEVIFGERSNIDIKEDELKQAANRASIEYSDYCEKREKNILRTLLLKEM